MVTQSVEWVFEALPRETPAGWGMVLEHKDGRLFKSADGLAVIVSGNVEEDGKRWLHLSVSRRSYMPTWTDLRRVKETFLGDRYAAMVSPPPSVYVNIHPYCLHLWCCLDTWPLPEFSGLLVKADGTTVPTI